MSGLGVQAIYAVIKEELLAACSEYGRRHTCRRTKIRIIPRDRKLWLRKKTKLTEKLCREGIEARILLLEEQLAASHIEEIRQREEQAVESIKVNPKYFYDYAKSKCEVRVEIGPLLDGAGELISDPFRMSEILRIQFECLHHAIGGHCGAPYRQ